MWVRRLALVVALFAALPLQAQDALSLEEKAFSPSPIGPIRIVLLDGCEHAVFMQAAARTRTTLPVTIDSRYILASGAGCQLTLSKIKAGITALAKAEEAAQQLARRRHQPIPLTIFYIGTSFYGAPDAWRQGVERLARSAIIVAPSGNLPEYQAVDIWPSAAVKIGLAPSGEIQGSHGSAVSVYLDFDGVVIVINGVQWTTGATSTAAMLFASHLGNVLRRGVGTSRTPIDIQARIKTAFHEEIIEEEDLEERLEAVLK
jgi:hypothetical protein